MYIKKRKVEITTIDIQVSESEAIEAIAQYIESKSGIKGINRDGIDMDCGNDFFRGARITIEMEEEVESEVKPDND